MCRLMRWAGEQGVCLIPFGGGTSVTRALELPPLRVEPRPIISVDMRKVRLGCWAGVVTRSGLCIPRS